MKPYQMISTSISTTTKSSAIKLLIPIEMRSEMDNGRVSFCYIL